MDAMGSREAAMSLLLKLKQTKWKDLTSILALIYDLDYAGGARFLRANKGMGELFKTVMTAQTAGLKERYNEKHGLVKDTRARGGRRRTLLSTVELSAHDASSLSAGSGGGARNATTIGTRPPTGVTRRAGANRLLLKKMFAR